MPNKIDIVAVASSDDAEIAWSYNYKIKDCWGFAILRQKKGESEAAADWVKSSVGFEDEPHKDFEFHDTTMWPIQKYNWTDYLVNNGDTVRYKVIPMIHKNDKLEKDEANASRWSNWTTLSSKKTDAYFNRGAVASQFVAKRLMNLPVKEKQKTLDEHLNDEKSPLREFMGGTLLPAVYSILDEPTLEGKKDVHLFTALYELNDAVLIKKLNKLGKRAHVILANGAFKKPSKDDPGDPDPQKENAKQLTKVDLQRRIVSGSHFAHNKFVVLATKKGNTFSPYKVLTGSTNWTHNGLFKQANNALIIDDVSVAKYYLEEWHKISEDCDANGKGLYAKPFKTANATVKKNTKGDIRTWFDPTKELADLNDAIDLINKAKQGILFLMFQPGSMETALLYKAIYDRTKEKNPIFINGVINIDPGGSKTPSIQFMNKGKREDGDMTIVTPANIKQDFGFWKTELARPTVTIHSKAIVIDPFGKNPVVITGSNNMGKKASESNDDNLNIITGNSALAQSYAVHMLSVYHHYRWRFYRSKVTDKDGNEKDNTPKWKGLKRSDVWQGWFDKGSSKKEIDFWFGK
ncbi:phospholipase D-like domain-containing protein [Ferruginibacter sp.]